MTSTIVSVVTNSVVNEALVTITVQTDEMIDEDVMIGLIGKQIKFLGVFFFSRIVSIKLFNFCRRRPDYREYRPRDRFSPDRGGPPMKRMRGDWPGDDRRYHGMQFSVHIFFAPFRKLWKFNS